MDDAELYLDDHDKDKLEIKDLETGSDISSKKLKQLIHYHQSPYPNNFYACNMLMDLSDDKHIKIDPYPPNGIKRIECWDYNGDTIKDLKKSHVLEP